MDNKNKQNPKAEEIRLRRMEVERLHIWGLSILEIAQKLNVDERTIGRDIHDNRKEKLYMVVYGDGHTTRIKEAREWLRNELADYIAFMDMSKRKFLEQSETFKTEASRLKALWCAVEIMNKKVETIKSLMFSIDDIATGGMRIHEDADI
jgi:IS30 family transposase